VVLRAGADQPYDVVLADPPYALGDVALSAVLNALVSGGWLAPAALIVVERAARALPPAWPDGVFELTNRRYGDTTVYYGCHVMTSFGP
jgi:16S rRNA G966 N2-methylase RsmD